MIKVLVPTLYKNNCRSVAYSRAVTRFNLSVICQESATQSSTTHTSYGLPHSSVLFNSSTIEFFHKGILFLYAALPIMWAATGAVRNKNEIIIKPLLKIPKSQKWMAVPSKIDPTPRVAAFVVADIRM